MVVIRWAGSATSVARLIVIELIWLPTSVLSPRVDTGIARSDTHNIFSAATRGTPRRTRAQIVEHHYRPCRVQVGGRVGHAVSRGDRVIHISSHRFTAGLDGRVRGADVGLLYHPGRRGEAEVRPLEGIAGGIGSGASGTPQ